MANTTTAAAVEIITTLATTVASTAKTTILDGVVETTTLALANGTTEGQSILKTIETEFNEQKSEIFV